MKKNNLLLTFLFLMHISLSLFGESIEFSADFVRYDSAEGNEFTVLSGNAYVKTGNKEITADEIRLYGKDYNILVCEGDVEVIDSEEEIKINSETLFYNRETKITRISSRSVMEDYKNEMIIKSGFLEFKQKDEILFLQIGVRILKEDLTCRCEFATYDKNSNSLLMTGLPVVYKEDDTFRASKITVLLDTDEIRMDGKVEGSLILEDQEDDSANDEEQ